MGNLFILGFCLISGICLRHWRKLPSQTPQVLNSILINLALPTLILGKMNHFSVSQSAWYLIGVAWIGFGLSFGFFYLLGRYKKLNPKIIGALILTAGLGNTSFVGFPLIEAIYGAEFLKSAVIIDQLGSFLVISTLAVITASYYSSRKIGPKAVLKNVLTFPPVVALALALLFKSYNYPPSLSSLFTRLGDTVTPLALISVGYQLRINKVLLQKYASLLTIGLVFKLILAPLFLAAIYFGLFHAQGSDITICIIEAAMAPMITAAIVATEYGLDAELSGLMVGIGIPISLITVPIWAAILKWI